MVVNPDFAVLSTMAGKEKKKKKKKDCVEFSTIAK